MPSFQSDGVRIAYATAGSGPPLVRAAHWLNHVEFERESPVWQHWTEAFAADHTFIRYDDRGGGLSDWDVPTLDFEGFVQDLEAVVDALELERFPLSVRKVSECFLHTLALQPEPGILVDARDRRLGGAVQ